MLTRILAILLLILMVRGMTAQERLISEQSLLERQTEIQALSPDRERQAAGEFARENRLPERITYRDGTVLEIRKLSPSGLPMYYKTFNLNAARTISTDAVWEGGASGLTLSGSGIIVGVWDAGMVRISHDEFQGRARNMDGSNEEIDHATHVAGTIGAGGVKENAHGMAYRTTIDSYDWGNDNQEMRSAAGNGLLVSNHSYGFVQGWDYNLDKSRWEWWGDPDISIREDYNFGFYGEDAQTWDEIAADYTRYLIVKSAGNDRGEGPAPGASHFVYSQGGWKQSSVTRDLDGGINSFDCIGTQGTSKNILTVGAVDDIPDGYQQPSDVDVLSFSAFGPTDDGRIKPDIVANGKSLYSATSGADDSYGYSSGTSMSSPSVAGSLALLQEQFHNLHAKYMFSSQLKAVVLHTADEAGQEGPDFKYGWGLMNTRAAAELITSIPGERFIYDKLSDQEVKEFIFFCRANEEVRVTIVWTDPPGRVPSPQLNPKDRILVNDLDISLTRQVDHHQFQPWILDPANPSMQARTGDNNVDNVEQISIKTPLPGFYTLRISHKSSLDGGEQDFALVVTGLDKDYIASGHNVLEEANGSILLTSADEYLNNMDVEWVIQPGNGQPVSLYFDWLETELDNDVLTIYDGSDNTAPIIGQFSGAPGDSDTMITASADEMFITFSSDDQEVARGFLARYCTVPPEGDYTISGSPYPCENSEASYFALGQEGAYFNWEVSGEWILTERSNNGIDLSVGDTLGLLMVDPYNRCGSGIGSSINIIPQMDPPELTDLDGDTIPCAGISSILATNTLPGVTYQWKLPESWVGTSNSDSLFYIPGSNPGLVSVTGYNACGPGNELFRSIHVIDVPDRPSVLTDKVPPCALTTQDFFVNALPGHSYLWEVNDDWKIIGEADEDTVKIEVGASESFLFITSTNRCGTREGSRLFLTSPVPPAARVIKYNGIHGLPELEVTNMHEIESIQWLRNGEKVPGESGRSNPLVVNMNGIYGAESVSDNGCRNPGSEQEEVLVNHNHLAFLAYRLDEHTICIQNTTSRKVNFRLVSMSGQVVCSGEAGPGHNEFLFTNRGVYLVHISDNGVDQKYKALF
ncbi:MAG: S8 family serine peptidase [Bacteroidota bacterium]